MRRDDAHLLQRASELLETGQAQDALRCLAQIDETALSGEERTEFYALRAAALSEAGHHQEALALLDEALEEAPDSARLHGTRGLALFNVGDLHAARTALEQALRLDPADESALANLAFVHERLGNHPRALELYDQAIDLGADIDWVLQRKAAVQTEMGDTDAARRTLRRYLSLVPDDAAQWIALAILYTDDRQYEAAFECYRAAAQIDPHSPVLRLNWGVTAVRAGALGVAQEQLQALARLEPGAARPLLLSAFIREEQGRPSEAARLYERALERVRGQDAAQTAYALEMAMDFFLRQRDRRRCDQLLRQAYEWNACTVELCEAYRQLTARPSRSTCWFSLMVEADYRPGLVSDSPVGSANGARRRYLRNFQVVARDRDEAISMVLDFVRRMGEKHPTVREFVREEALPEAHPGIYEVQHDCTILDDDAAP